MLNIGLIIAAGILVIYLVLGPIVILGFYVFFDRLAETAGDAAGSSKQTTSSPDEKDPALWTDQDIRRHVLKKSHMSSSSWNANTDDLRDVQGFK